MPIVPRYFEPSVRGGKRKSREQSTRDPWAKLMVGGGREGPEVGRKPLRTPRVTEATVGEGSTAWSSELEAGKTKKDARTQPPFLRDTRGMDLAYRQGLMSVSDALRVAQEALEYAKKDPNYVPRIEYTGVGIRGGLASAYGKLVDADVDTLSRDLSADWAGELSRLAADIRAVEATVPRSVGVPVSDYVGRVYLNLARVSIPVEQFAVLMTGGKGGGAEAYGVYSPGSEDGPVRYKGEVLLRGTPIRLPVSAVQFVTFDPPEYRQKVFIDSPAFARSRGILLEPDADVARRLGLKPGEPYIVPYSQILRLRMIYPPAQGYERKSSKVIESTATLERDLKAAQRRINTIRDALVTRIRATMSRSQAPRADARRAAAVIHTDGLTKLQFTLEDVSFAGTADPIVVWVTPPGGDTGLVGRPVTPVDFLRALRAVASTDTFRKLRNE